MTHNGAHIVPYLVNISTLHTEPLSQESTKATSLFIQRPYFVWLKQVYGLAFESVGHLLQDELHNGSFSDFFSQIIGEFVHT